MRIIHSITTIDNNRKDMSFYIGNGVSIFTINEHYDGIIVNITNDYISLKHPKETNSFININFDSIVEINPCPAIALSEVLM